MNETSKTSNAATVSSQGSATVSSQGSATVPASVIEKIATYAASPTRALAQQEEANEMIDHPEHYGSRIECIGCGGPIECIDIVEHFSFNMGNAIKYIWLAARKEDKIQDLKEAIWYLERVIYNHGTVRERADQDKFGSQK